MHPYIDMTTIKHNTFPPFSITTLFSCSGFNLHMVSIEYPFNFRITHLSFGISDCSYASGTSNVVTFLLEYMSMNRVVNMASNETIGGDIFSPSFKYFSCLMSLSHVLSFVWKYLFSLMIFTESRACIFYFSCRHLESIGINNGLPFSVPLSICWNYFTVPATAISPNILTPSFVYICVNITFSASCIYDFFSSALVFLDFWRNFLWLIYCYILPSGLVFNMLMPVPEFYLVRRPKSSLTFVLSGVSLSVFPMLLFA